MAFKYVNMADITRAPSGARRQNLTRDSAQDAPSSANGRADLITHVELSQAVRLSQVGSRRSAVSR